MLPSYRVTLSGSFAPSMPEDRRAAALQRLTETPDAELEAGATSTFTIRLRVRAVTRKAAHDAALEVLINAVHAAWLTVDAVAVESATAVEDDG